MEEEDFEVVSLIIQGFVITILCIFGIIGSILSTLVLMHREMRSAVSSLLIGLTVSDTIFVLGQLQMVGIYYIVHYLNPTSYYVSHFQPFCLPYWWYASSLAQTAGLCYAISITIERYIAICHPFYAKTYCSWKKANYLSIVILIISSVYALPNLFAFQTVLVDNETSTHGIYPTEFGESELFEEYYEFWANMIVHVFIPFTILIILNIFIILKMRAVRKVRLQMTTARMPMGTSQLARQQKQIQVRTSSTNTNTTNMLICIVIVFSICYTPVTIYRVWERSVSPTSWDNTAEVEFYNEHKFNLFVLLTIGRVTVTTNSSMNFIIYCVMGRKFRNLLRRMFHLQTKSGLHHNNLHHRNRYRHHHHHPNGVVNLIRCKTTSSTANNNSISVDDPDPDADDGFDVRRDRSVVSNSEDGF